MENNFKQNQHKKGMFFAVILIAAVFASAVGLLWNKSSKNCKVNKSAVYNILDFGAVGDGVTVNTKAIQSAIDKCSANGGGRVVIPTGKFISGSIYLKNNVELHLASAGSILKASSNFDDYNALDAYVQNWKHAKEKMNGGHFIMAIEQKNIAITGLGTIDGSGDAFMSGIARTDNEYYCFWSHGFSIVADQERTRPGQMLAFIESGNILLDGVKICNSPYWTVYLYGCDNVRVSRLNIFNPPYRLNSDGIDIDCSSNVVVSDCIIATGDDALTLRGSSGRLKKQSQITENITVSNCILKSGGAYGVRVGVGSGVIRNAVFSNIVIHDSSGGIKFQSKYGKSNKHNGTTIDNIRFNNIIGTGLKVPFFITLGHNSSSSISNITVSDSSFDLEHTCAIVGNNIGKVSNITLRNVEFNVVNRLKGVDNHKFDFSKYAPSSPCLDTVWVFAHSDITLDNFKLNFTPEARKMWRHDVVTENVKISGNYKLTSK